MGKGVSEPVDRFLRVKDVAELLGISRSTIYSMVQKGQFPAPVKLTPNTVVWRQSVVVAFMDSVYKPQ